MTNSKEKAKETDRYYRKKSKLKATITLEKCPPTSVTAAVSAGFRLRI